MTLGDWHEICYKKISEENPLRYPPIPFPVTSEEEYSATMDQITQRYMAQMDHSDLLADEMTKIYESLCDKLGIATEVVATLPTSTELPSETVVLIEKFRDFPVEITEGQ